jgi:hypothetical protein
MLTAGSLVRADGIVLGKNGFFVNQSVLMISLRSKGPCYPGSGKAIFKAIHSLQKWA